MVNGLDVDALLLYDLDVLQMVVEVAHQLGFDSILVVDSTVEWRIVMGQGVMVDFVPFA